MGNCCGYLRVTSNMGVTDPSALESIKVKCDTELWNTVKIPSKTKNGEDIVCQENYKINSSQNNSYTSPNKDDITTIKEDAIIIKKSEETKESKEIKEVNEVKEVEVKDVKEVKKSKESTKETKEGINLQFNIVINTDNIILKPGEESPSKRKNLKPLASDQRRDSRSTTSVNVLKKEKKTDAETEKKAVDLRELKLSPILMDKIQKLQSQTIIKKSNENTILRSITMGNDGSADGEIEIDEKEEDDKTKDEINKELKDNKEIMEKNQKKLTILQSKVEENQAPEISGQHTKKKSTSKHKQEDPIPRKSLLKRYKTIGNVDDKKKKGKKKVKFQDLVDKKKKKKLQANFKEILRKNANFSSRLFMFSTILYFNVYF